MKAAQRATRASLFATLAATIGFNAGVWHNRAIAILLSLASVFCIALVWFYAREEDFE